VEAEALLDRLGTGCEGAAVAAQLAAREQLCQLGRKVAIRWATAARLHRYSTNLESTSSVAASEAAEACARSKDGSAFVGLLLAQADNHIIDSMMQLIRRALDALKLSRSARTIAVPRAGLCDHLQKPSVVEQAIVRALRDNLESVSARR